MSIRLQVLLEEDELAEIRAIARRQRMSVSEWVRQVLRAARARQPHTAAHVKLQALRTAMTYNFPTADIDDMLREIEQGYVTEAEG